jgi:4-hydroxy-tetrahydrodipicolinate reductase
MKLAIIGYGKMGKAIETLALQQGDEIVSRIDSSADWDTQNDILENAETAIEFSVPDAAPENIRRCFDRKLPVVCGTTGWDAQLPAIEQECARTGNTLFAAPNFSLGVNIFFRLNRQLAAMMNQFEDYDLNVEEIHHIHKLDAPSGTAKVLVNDLLTIVERKNNWALNRKTNPASLKVTARRIKEVAGTHIVRYFSDIDEIEIKHTAKSRTGFANGALHAARWIKGKTGFFTMEDMMQQIFDQKNKIT